MASIICQKRIENGSWEHPVNVDDYKVVVIWESRQVPVMSLEYEIQAYRILGREEKVRLLEQWLRYKPLSYLSSSPHNME